MFYLTLTFQGHGIPCFSDKCDGEEPSAVVLLPHVEGVSYFLSSFTTYIVHLLTHSFPGNT